MGIYNWILLLTRPTELWSLLQFYMYYQGRSNAMKKHPACERRSMQRCWELLSLHSTSAYAIIKVLDADLAQTVSISTVYQLSSSVTWFTTSNCRRVWHVCISEGCEGECNANFLVTLSSLVNITDILVTGLYILWCYARPRHS
jgi:hypothetical protein